MTADDDAVRRVRVPRHGGPEVLRVERVPRPAPAAGEVLVRVLAAGVAFPDVLMREGTYPGGPAVPFTPGYDLVGERLDTGERVAALTVWGAQAEIVAVPAARLVPVPAGLDDAEAVALVLDGVTALQLVHRAAAVRTGETVLVPGARGGVGRLVVALAALAGARAIGVGRGDARPRGVDVALDGIGGRSALQSVRATRRGGRVVLYGHHATLAGGRRSAARVGWFYAAGAAALACGARPGGPSVTRYQVAREAQADPMAFAADLTALFGLLAEGSLRPAIAGRLPLERVAEAHARLGAGGLDGKLVLIP